VLKSLFGSRIVHLLYFTFFYIFFNTNFSRAPSITIHPTALFSILDHYLRRTDTQQRVIGTLLGTRSEGDDTVSVRTAFAVPHSETSEQVAVDMDYHRAMFDLSQRVNPKESIVGWYAFPWWHFTRASQRALTRTWLSAGSGIRRDQI
jgi:proteasome lid subunit RPN8/RPN11